MEEDEAPRIYDGQHQPVLRHDEVISLILTAISGAFKGVNDAEFKDSGTGRVWTQKDERDAALSGAASAMRTYVKTKLQKRRT